MIQDVVDLRLSCKAIHDHKYHHVLVSYVDCHQHYQLTTQNLPQLALLMSIAACLNVCVLGYESGMLNLLMQVA